MKSVSSFSSIDCRYAVNYIALKTQHLHISNVTISIKVNFKQNGIRRHLTSENYKQEGFTKKMLESKCFLTILISTNDYL